MARHHKGHPVVPRFGAITLEHVDRTLRATAAASSSPHTRVAPPAGATPDRRESSTATPPVLASRAPTPPPRPAGHAGSRLAPCKMKRPTGPAPAEAPPA